jgi:hypothetical protein
MGDRRRFFFVRLCTLVEIPAVEDESDGNMKHPFPYKFVPFDRSYILSY